VHPPLTFESLAAAFFLAFALVAPLTRAPKQRRARAALLSAALVVAVIVATLVSPDLRGWFGHGYLVAGYWIPALLVTSPYQASRFENWLILSDLRYRTFAITLPVWAVSILELSYLLCYVLVPIAFVFVWSKGTPVDVDRFWTAVLLSGYVCYGSLPWLISRPPRVLNASTNDTVGVRGVNQFVLTRVSHGLNTFPSGHVAVSLAAALGVLPVSRPAGTTLLVIAAAIAAGAIVGRYHYAVDVAFGAVLGVLAWLLV
jgi:membrane-associated phospholipid phosphatase